MVIQFVGTIPPQGTSQLAGGSYLRLLRSAVFLRYALSHAFVLGGLLIFVFGSPFVIVQAMHGVISQFIAMQIVGVGCFIGSANATGFLVQRYGSESLILSGTLLAAGSALLILVYAIAGGHEPSMLIYLFFPMNIGLGLRGPPGFFQAIRSGGGDDERAASFTILAIMAVSALGTALLAPFIHHGLAALAAALGFYIGTLGFRLIEDTPVPSQQKRWVVVAPAGSRSSHLLLARAVGDEQSSRIGNQTGGRVFLFLYTDDFWRDFRTYQAKGVVFVRKPKEEPHGTAAVFKDLYGNLWDLLQPRASTIAVQ